MACITLVIDNIGNKFKGKFNFERVKHEAIFGVITIHLLIFCDEYN